MQASTIERPNVADLERIIWRADLPKLLECSASTICRWIKDGKLPEPDVNMSIKSRGWKLRTLHEAGIRL